MSDWNLRTLADENAAECDAVRQWLREHNWSVNPGFMGKLRQAEHQSVPLVLVAGSDAKIVGGLLAETQMAWLRVSIMAVDPWCWSQGIGSALLAEAERQAIARGCRHAYVDTMAYQAPNFYLKRGYKVMGEIPDWDSHGHTKYYLTKGLGASTESQAPLST